MADLASETALPPEHRVLIELLPETRAHHQTDSLPAEFLRRRTDKQRFRPLPLPDIGDILQAFPGHLHRPATGTRLFLRRQYLNADWFTAIHVRSQSLSSQQSEKIHTNIAPQYQ
jgi:hypothetical protein